MKLSRSTLLPLGLDTMILAAALSALAPIGHAVAATLIVPDDYPTIQAAIDAAASGDEVLVEPGVYAENIALVSDIVIAGREAARTWLVPADDRQPTVSIAGAANARISNLTMTDTANGINVVGSTGIVIANIVFDNVTNVAIAVEVGSDVEIVNNTFFDNAVGISRNTVNAVVTNNIFRSNNVTIRSPSNLVGNDQNVDSNCWSNNDDLRVGGVDTSYGTNAVIGNPLLVDPTVRDFHLQQGSPCIDIGVGDDVIDDTPADAGAYGGPFADASPFPVDLPVLTDSSTSNPAVTRIDVSWEANTSYLVTNETNPGGYRVYYRQNDPGPPWDGTDAGGGTLSSPILAGDVTQFTLDNLIPDAPQLIAPELVSAEGINAGVALTWNRVEGAIGYRVHYGVDSIDENAVDTGDVRTFTVTGLDNGVTYRFAVSALSQATYFVSVTAFDSTPAAHESDFSPEASLLAGPVSQSNESTEFTALPQLILAFPPLRDEGGCFIATAAFGADWEREVEILRNFRDEVLMKSSLGRWFVAQYYHLSPAPADWLREMPRMRALVRALLMPAVALAWFMTEAGILTQTSVAVLSLAAAAAIVRRRYFRRTRNDEAQV
ncbi:MAG: right-handed parallel beta-helix repeat-containing protein [Gammaproteobacteria bacterium]